MKASVRFTGESTPSHTHTQRERGGEVERVVEGGREGGRESGRERSREREREMWGLENDVDAWGFFCPFETCAGL